MDRFLLAENPMVDRDNNPIYIFHTQDPAMLIQVHHEAIAIGNDISFTGNYKNTDGVIETITFTVAALLICESHASEQTRERVKKVLNKAWHWYTAYLKWEDDNIDRNESAELN